MRKICIIIRVYNRVEDLKHCLSIIKDTWTNFEYYIIVVSNGKKKGFLVDQESKGKINQLVELEENSGHLKGNSQLLLQGLPYIPDNCDYTILLEADTWIYSDVYIKKYISKLDKGIAVWASAKWYDSIFSLATDFAIVQSKFIKNHWQILDFGTRPEDYVANFLIDNNFQFIYITENMPIHVPSYIHHYPYTRGNRFNMFPKAKMVTYHVENLKGGMQKKKEYFNILSNTKYFDILVEKSSTLERVIVQMSIYFSYLLPRKSWFNIVRRIK